MSYLAPVRPWRATTSEAVQDDLDEVVTAALDAAQAVLTKRGEFFPFGVTVSGDGHVGLSQAWDPSLGEQPASLDVLDGLYAGVIDHRQAYRAVGFVADVKANGGDAVRIEAEHRDGGPPLVILMPYQRAGRLRKTVTYGQMAASEGARRVWPSA